MSVGNSEHLAGKFDPEQNKNEVTEHLARFLRKRVMSTDMKFRAILLFSKV